MISRISQDQMEYILSNMDDAVCITTARGVLIYANAAARQLFGFDEDIGEETKIWEAIPYVPENDGLVQMFIDGIMEKRASFHSLVPYVNTRGEQFQLYVRLSCNPEDAKDVIVVATDLTRLTQVQSAFERYTSPEIADYALNTEEGGKQGGQDREVTVLMSDLRGFTALSMQLSSTELVTMLNHYFEAMSDVIAQHGGTIIEFLGDGIFVVFGAPKDMPDHASAAVRCAIGMQNRMAEVNAWNREHGYPIMEMGIGISSGRVVVGNIGSEKKMKYGCMGAAVNLAGRLETFCIGGQIFIAQNTREMISEDLAIADEKSFMPKGGQEELKIYQITGIGKDCFLAGEGEETRWQEPPLNLEILFFTLEEKTVKETGRTGILVRISENERFALLKTDEKLAPLDNLMFRHDEQDFYVKVLWQEGEGWRIGFTYHPEKLTGTPPQHE